MPDSTTTGPVRICVVDDHQLVLDGLVAMLEGYRDRIEVVGQANTATSALETARECRPDVVLLDVRLHNESGLDLCTELLRQVPGVRVVFLTVYDDEQYLFQALRLGASGFLLKRVTGS